MLKTADLPKVGVRSYRWLFCSQPQGHLPTSLVSATPHLLSSALTPLLGASRETDLLLKGLNGPSWGLPRLDFYDPPWVPFPLLQPSHLKSKTCFPKLLPRALGLVAGGCPNPWQLRSWVPPNPALYSCWPGLPSPTVYPAKRTQQARKGLCSLSPLDGTPFVAWGLTPPACQRRRPR